MSYPRYSPPDDAVHGMRTTDRGRGFLSPRRVIVHGFLVILARASEKYDIGISAWSLMANHWHIVCFDRNPDGPSRLGKFRQFLHGCFAKFLNAYWGTEGHIVCKDSISNVIRIIDANCEASAVVYVESNPVAAGLVMHPQELEGATSLRKYHHEPFVAERPDVWFREKRWERSYEIRLEIPPKAREQGHDEETWRMRTEIDLFLRLMGHLERLISERNDFSSLEELREMNPDIELGSKADHSVVPFTSSDRVASAIEFMRERRFQRTYRISREQVRSGETDVTFPYGTLRLAHTMNVTVRSRPEPFGVPPD